MEINPKHWLLPSDPGMTIAVLTAKSGGKSGKGYQEMGKEALGVSLVRRGHPRYEKQHRQDVGMGWNPGSILDRTEASTVVLQNKSLDK